MPLISASSQVSGWCTPSQPSPINDEGEQNKGVKTDFRSQSITTLMLCGIPCRLDVEGIKEALDHHGFAGTYDLVYTPTQKAARKPAKRLSNMGYAFVNFKTAESAGAFMESDHTSLFPDTKSKKATDFYAQPAMCQGFALNVAMRRKHRTGSMRTFTESTGVELSPPRGSPAI
jgi:hypothetical protein